MNKRKNPLVQQCGQKNEYAGKYFYFRRDVLYRIVIRRVKPALRRSAMPDQGAATHNIGA
jgi:hypothetical protein